MADFTTNDLSDMFDRMGDSAYTSASSVRESGTALDSLGNSAKTFGSVLQSANSIIDETNKLVSHYTGKLMLDAYQQQKANTNLLGRSIEELDKQNKTLVKSQTYFMGFGIAAKDAMDMAGKLTSLDEIYGRAGAFEEMAASAQIATIEHGSNFMTNMTRGAVHVISEGVSSLKEGLGDAKDILTHTFNKGEVEAAVAHLGEVHRSHVKQMQGNLVSLYRMSGDEVATLHETLVGKLKVGSAQEDEITRLFTNSLRMGLKPTDALTVLQDNHERLLMVDNAGRAAAVKMMLESAVLQKKAGVDFARTIEAMPRPENQMEQVAILAATTGKSFEEVSNIFLRAQGGDSKAVREYQNLKSQGAHNLIGGGYNADLEREMRSGKSDAELALKYGADAVKNAGVNRMVSSTVLSNTMQMNTDDLLVLDQVRENLQSVTDSLNTATTAIKTSLGAYTTNISSINPQIEAIISKYTEDLGKGIAPEGDSGLMQQVQNLADKLGEGSDVIKNIFAKLKNTQQYNLDDKLDLTKEAEMRERMATPTESLIAVDANVQAAMLDTLGKHWTAVSQVTNQIEIFEKSISTLTDKIGKLSSKLMSIVSPGETETQQANDGLLDIGRGKLYNFHSQDQLLAFKPGGPVNNFFAGAQLAHEKLQPARFDLGITHKHETTQVTRRSNTVSVIEQHRVKEQQQQRQQREPEQGKTNPYGQNLVFDEKVLDALQVNTARLDDMLDMLRTHVTLMQNIAMMDGHNAT